MKAIKNNTHIVLTMLFIKKEKRNIYTINTASMIKLLISAVILIAITIAVLISCSTIPKNVTAIKPFDANNYLGKWYEIARLDFRFEKNLNNTTANYSDNPDGSIKVINRGYNYKSKKWK
jgi:apolipoprotein D and lipocalin family protein